MHILDGADDFRSYLAEIDTPLGVTTDPAWQFDVGDYDADGRADLFAINKNDNGRTAVHVLDGAQYFQVWDLAYVSHRWARRLIRCARFDVGDYDGDHRADLYAININDNGRTAVHVLSAASSFQSFTLHTLTPLGAATDPNWQFDIGDYDRDGRGDLFALYKNDRGQTAVHVLSATSNFQVWTLHTLSALQRTDDPIWDLEVGLEGTGADVRPSG